MDLLHIDEQRHKSGQYIRTDILALLSNIKNCVDKVGSTEDTTNALIAYALHLTNCYGIPRWGIENFVICSLMRLTVAESGKVVALNLILKCHPYSVAPFMLQILLLLCKSKCHIIIHIHMPERTSAMQEQIPHHHSYTHARKDETFLVRWLKCVYLCTLTDKWSTMAVILAKFPQKQAIGLIDSQLTLLRTYSVYVPVLLLMANLNQQKELSHLEVQRIENMLISKEEEGLFALQVDAF
ncbi:hypothetical protein ACFE04_029762 [Oxalis oulophora]